jgi:predicted membrane-bound spermidine synthase
MTSVVPARALPTGLLIGLGAVVFLANAGLLVLQLLAGRFLAPFIGSSVETWTCVIGVFLTGIALGNHFGGRIADRSPSTRTLGLLLLLGSISSLSFILWWYICQGTGFDRIIPLTPRIPILAILFCLPPAFVLSLMTPLTIKLMLPDVSQAGRIAGLVFALSTLGCLVGNYFTGFWLMANYTLNAITVGVAIGLVVLALPMLLLNVRLARTPLDTVPAPKAANKEDDLLGFRKDIRRAFLVVFLASFCGMSLELTASRVLAPTLGVSLYTWTGIIGVMLAGTACGNYLGGVLADRGTRAALLRFSLLIGTAVGFAVGPAFVRTLRLDGWPGEGTTSWWSVRVIFAAIGLGVVLLGIRGAYTHRGRTLNLFAVGAFIGFLAAHPIVRSFGRLVEVEDFHSRFAETNTSIGFDLGSLVIHLAVALLGGLIALGLGYNSPQTKQTPAHTGALPICLFAASLFTGLVVLMNLFFQNPVVGIYQMLTGTDIVWNVMTWTFILFFLPMLALGTISPQVIRLSIRDAAHAGRTAGSVYAWSTAGAIVGTFVTGYFFIDWFGMSRVLCILSLVLMGMAFVLGHLWKNTPMLFAGSMIGGIAFAGLLLIGYAGSSYDLETKYYAIRVRSFESDDHKGGKFMARAMDLDHLMHSFINPEDPSWLGYEHEEIQGELVRYARSKGPTEILIIGGGGYTFPRWIEYMMPDVGVDVVEIDPGVTEVAHRKMGLSRTTKIRSHHLDGRQFIREKAKPRHYQYVFQDAVNDLSVPYHLMTKEYNDTVKETLAPGGAYLLTLIDSIEKGGLCRAAIATLRKSFAHVELLHPKGFRDGKGNYEFTGRYVYVIYASDVPLDLTEIHAVAVEAYLRQGLDKPPYTVSLERAELDAILEKRPGIVLTDQYAPVDNLMSSVFKDQSKEAR